MLKHEDYDLMGTASEIYNVLVRLEAGDWEH